MWRRPKLNACKINETNARVAYRPALSLFSLSELLTMLKGLKKHESKTQDKTQHEKARSKKKKKNTHKATHSKNNITA